MTKRTVLLVLAASVVAFCAPAAEFPLKLKERSAEQAFSFPGGYGQRAHVTAKKPGTIANEPKARSERPLYGTFDLTEDRKVAFRLDESKGTGKGYDRLIIDLNGNSDLSDDLVQAAPREPSWRSLDSEGGVFEKGRFGPIDISTGQETGPWRPRVFGQTFIYRQSGPIRISDEVIFYSGCHLETTVEFDGVRQKIGFADGNCNMRLGDVGVVDVYERSGKIRWWFQWQDAVLRDHDGSGTFANFASLREYEFPSPLMYFGSKPYTWTLAADGSAVRTRRYKGPVGELRIPRSENVKALTLGWQNAAGQWKFLEPRPENGRIEVPVGTYSLHGCIVTATDEHGVTVAVPGSTEKPDNPVKIEAGETAKLVCGLPLEMRVLATKSKSSRIEIDLEFAGAGGELYDISRCRKFTEHGSIQPEPPRFKILDETGREIASGQFEYG